MSRTTLLLAVLFASLALNVFIGGAFVGARMAREDEPRRPAAAGPRTAVAAAVATLSPEAQAAWRSQARTYGEAYGPKTREARRLLRETLQGFGAEPFDDDRAIRELARARALEFEVRQAMDQRLVQFAATLPQAERARFGEALARPPLRRAGGGERRGAAGVRVEN
ncbi:periplasmic heavy metal sensor [Phenylobacterium sp.]|uniref:periplasmic heavy metal sensor n=1 Tax=Phenylobacterium sp. TaxID=1871053 RepID=UPI0025EDC261|nr:periplasmic heavy metal sensor [Phenylobacterium sp.]